MTLKIIKIYFFPLIFTLLFSLLITSCSNDNHKDESLTSTVKEKNTPNAATATQALKDPFALSILLIADQAFIKKIPPTIELTVSTKKLNIISFNSQKFRKTKLMSADELIELWNLSLTDEEYTPYASINFNGAIYSAIIKNVPALDNNHLIFTLSSIEKIETLNETEKKLSLIIENVGKTHLQPHEIYDIKNQYE